MFAPEQAVVFVGQLCHLIGDHPHQFFLLRILHIDGRAHMQNAGVHMAEHAILQLMAVQQRAQLDDVVREIFRRHRCVFDKRDRARFALAVAEQADRLFAHTPQTIYRRSAPGNAVAQASGIAFASGQRGNQAIDTRAQFRFIVGGVFHQIDALDARAVRREKLRHFVPDDIAFGEVQDFGIDGFDTGGLRLHQAFGIAQGAVEIVVLHHRQSGKLGDGHQVEFYLSDKTQGAFTAAQNIVEVEAALLVADMRQIVASQAAIQFRKFGVDERVVFFLQIVHQTVDQPNAILLIAKCVQFLFRQRAGTQYRAVQQYRGQLQYVIAGFAVEAGALAGGVGIDHAADGGAVTGGQLRREEQTERLERSVQLVLDYTCFHPHPALGVVDLQNAIHMAGDIHHQTIRQRLPVGASAAAAR